MATSIKLCSYCDQLGHDGPWNCPLWQYEQTHTDPPPLCSYCLDWLHTTEECPNLEPLTPSI